MPSSIIKVFRRALHGVLFGASLGSLAVLCNIVQVVTLLLYPFNRKLVGQINALICDAIWRTINVAMERRNGARITFSGDHAVVPMNKQPVLGTVDPTLPPTESAIVICNHLCAIDWAVINTLAIRRGMLAHGKYFIKSSMKYLPLFGPGMLLAGFPFLSRNWASDQHKIDAIFKTLREDRLPCWLISFLEGTRLTPKKLAESQAFCQQNGRPVLQNVMYPRKKGLVATLSALRDSHVHYVYDMTIAYRYRPTGAVNEVFPNVATIHTDYLGDDWDFHLHVDRIPIADIPEDPAVVEQWIEDRWVKKDQLIAQWKAAWPGTTSKMAIPAKL
ncbi:hypothetical protein GGF32_009134 [Allomyces javanicus]|nr:hypothetical protein GGF32_009134 [Allomyces javanicus]